MMKEKKFWPNSSLKRELICFLTQKIDNDESGCRGRFRIVGRLARKDCVDITSTESFQFHLVLGCA